MFHVEHTTEAMNIAKKIQSIFEAATGLPLVYGTEEAINRAIGSGQLPCGLLKLMGTSSLTTDGGMLTEEPRLSVAVVNLTQFDMDSYDNEDIIADCKTKLENFLLSLMASRDLTLEDVTEVSRLYDHYDDIVTGIYATFRLREVVGVACPDGSAPVREIKITDNGTYNVEPYAVAIVDVQGGAPAVVEQLDVVPDYDAHTFVPAEGVDGFNPVNVAACPIPQTETLHVTPTNVPQQFTPSAGNVGFSIVDVDAAPTPTLVACPVTPSTSVQHITPPAGADGFSEVDVQAVDSSIDADIQPINIRQGVDILGVVGTLQEITKQPLNITPSTSAQTYTAPTGEAYDPVQVDAVTASIDPNITPGNIKKDVSILGVEGTMGDFTWAFRDYWKNEIKLTKTNAYDGSFLPEELIDEYNDCTSIGAYFLNGSTVKKVVSHGTGSWSTGRNTFRGQSSLEYVEIDSLTTLGNETFDTGAMGSRIKFFKCINCTITTGYVFMRLNCPLEYFEVGTLTAFSNATFYRPMLYLCVVKVGQDTDVDLQMSGWTATNVIAEGQSGIDELNYNVKTYLAERLKDNSGGSAKTITFGTALYNVLTADTLQAFYDRNWNVAYA